MRMIILSLVCLISACVSDPGKQAADRATAFYTSYLTWFASDTLNSYPPAELRRYVAADTIRRIAEIENMPEQELLTSDYFTYSQDYDPDWIKTLKIESARSYLGGEALQVWLGIENGKKLHLEVFMRREAGSWKVYRVRDIANGYEQPIFDGADIAQAAPEVGD